MCPLLRRRYVELLPGFAFEARANNCHYYSLECQWWDRSGIWRQLWQSFLVLSVPKIHNSVAPPCCESAWQIKRKEKGERRLLQSVSDCNCLKTNKWPNLNDHLLPNWPHVQPFQHTDVREHRSNRPFLKCTSGLHIVIFAVPPQMVTDIVL